MPDGERLGASFSIDTTALKAGLQQANRLIRESNSEFKAAAAGLDDWTKSEEGLTAKLKNLNDVADLQAKSVEALQKEYDRCIADGLDPMSAAAVKMRTDINKAKADLAKTQSETQKFTSKLEELKSGSNNAADSVEDLGESAEQLDGGFTIAKGAVATFIGNGLTKLADACKNAISNVFNLAESTRETRTAFAKLEQAFDSAGFSAQTAEGTMTELYGVLGDTDRATEASNLLAKMSENEADLETNTRILTGVFAEYGDSIPTEGLAEGMQATAQMGEVQGVLADALEWQGINLDEYNEKLGTMSSAEERAAYIQETLTGLYGESADAYRENNSALIEANEAQLDYTQTLGELGDKIEPITTKVREGFNKILEKVLELVDGADLDAFADTVENAFDTFVNSVLPKVVDGLGWVNDHKDSLIAGLAGIAAGFAAFKVAGIITSVTDALKGMSVAQWAVNAAMSASPITWVAVAIGALVAAIVLLIKNWDKVKEAGAAAWDWIKGAWKSAATWFDKTIITPIKNFFTKLWDSIKTKASDAWNGIKNVFSGVVNWFKTTIVNPMLNSTFFKVIGELAEGCWETIKAVWAVVTTWFEDTIVTPTKESFAYLWNSIKTAAEDAWNGIKNVWNVVKDWFDDKIITPVSNFFGDMWNGLKTKAADAWNGIKSVFSPVADWFENTFRKAWQKVKDVFSTGGQIFDGIKDGIVSAFKTVVNAIIKGVNKVVAVPFNAINNMLDKIRTVSIAGVKPFKNLISRFSVPQIPLLAKGGVVRGATNAIIGEDGAEAVVPLERNTEWIDKVADRLASKQSKSVIVNQTNNYAQAHTRYEIYKSKQQTAAAVRLALQGV